MGVEILIKQPDLAVEKIWVGQKFGWGTWIRTKIDGVRVRSSTVELSPNRSIGQPRDVGENI